MTTAVASTGLVPHGRQRLRLAAMAARRTASRHPAPEPAAVAGWTIWGGVRALSRGGLGGLEPGRPAAVEPP